NGTPDAGSTVFYNQYFGIARFSGRSYYGGHYGSDNDNWYDFFSAGGMDFIVISFEYDTTPDAGVLAWADALLASHASRRAIVLAHSLIGTGNPGAFSAQGQAVYDALKARPNFFLMLCGHVPGEGRRTDTYGGSTVATIMADYQGRTNGGSGWLRTLEFSPANSVIRVRTYSPWLDQSETDADSQFDLPYTMSDAAPFASIGIVPGLESGGQADVVWAGRAANTQYDWMVVVSDGAAQVQGPVWSFTTTAAMHSVEATAGPGGTIAPSGLTLHAAGTSPVFTIVPDPGFEIANVLVDGVTVGAAGTYTFDPLGADHTIQAVFGTVTGVGDGVPVAFALQPIVPNPMPGVARFSFAVPRECEVRLDVIDVRGRVAAVVADRTYAPGRYSLSWNGGGSRNGVAAGVYFLRFRAGETQLVRRFVLVK
ncbi:MAG TPA: hypothetical protein VFT32_05540, partial [Candidatus Eisenbacteria bacterium]|nr:hypothetical protein [Candidatus Eisenbacteria bacterium]